MDGAVPHIGTLREGPLHASLKRWCTEDGDRLEAEVDGYVVDIVRDGLLIEVQTGSFSKVKRKLAHLLDAGHRLRVVYPVPARKSIVRIDAAGEVLGRRRSPRKGSRLDVFGELVAIPELLPHPALQLQVVMTVVDEYRKHHPNKAWRRKGWVVEERRLVGIEEVVTLDGPSDLAGLLPTGLPDPFTTADIAAAAGCPRRLAQATTYCLRHAGAIEPVGKRGNTIEYRLP
ncbi:MAG: hypothetical protein QNJ77_03125 [Acidimicrobiia bacterium]|nr:hypothetical protein [Acidimicrobiia bacterium]